MFQSKALKDTPKRSKLYLWWIDTDISDYYYSFMHRFIENPIFQAKRLYQWYVNVFHNDFDFDGHSLFAIIEYKLKRMEKVLVKGHAIQDPKDLRALRLAIKLSGRLKDDGYEMKSYDRFEKKWGRMETWMTPFDRGGEEMFSWHSRNPKAIYEKDKIECRKDRLDMYIAADKKMRREQKWLYAILHSHLRNWWD